MRDLDGSLAGDRTAARATVAIGFLLSLVVAGLFLRYYVHAGPLWRDEIDSLHVASMPSFAEVLDASRYDSFPAAWTLLLHTWVRVGQGSPDIRLRGLGLAVGLGIVGVLWWSMRRFRVDAPLVVLLLFGLSPNTVMYGGQVRGYGLGALGLVWALGALWKLLCQPTVTAFLLAVAAAVLAVQSYYGNCFLLLALCTAGVAVALRRRDPSQAAWVIGVGATAALSLVIDLPSLRYAAGLSAVEQGSWGLRWYADVFWHGLAPGVPWLRWLWPVAVALAAWGVARRLRQRSEPIDGRAKDEALFAAVAAVGGVLAYVAYVEFISVRTQFWYYLPLMALLAACAEIGIDLLVCGSRSGMWVRLAVATVAAVPTAAFAFGVVAVRMTNIDQVAAVLARKAAHEDLIVLVPYFFGISFARYYDGATPWITVPDFEVRKFHLHAVVAEKMQLGGAAVRPELERIETTLQAGHRVWLIGQPPVPATDETVSPLPPPVGIARQQKSAPYFDNWELQLGLLVDRHSAEIHAVALPSLGPVNVWEAPPLFEISGWR